ncbi:unnamed protein product [Rhizopus stolonifer]
MFNKKNWISCILLFWLIYITPLCSAGLLNGYFSKETKSLFDIITNDDRFTRLTQEIERHGLTTHFKEIKASTVFAPVNDAFERYDLQKVKTSSDQILYHVVPVDIKSKKLWHGRLLETSAIYKEITQMLKVTTTLSGSITIGTGVETNGATVIEADIDASNGVIHTVDNLLTFPVDLDDTLALDEEIKDFSDQVKLATIDRDLKEANGYTIFATKGSAFGDQLTDIEKSYLDSKEGRHDLGRLLNHQISPEILYTTDLKDGREKIKTVEGSEDLDVVVDGDTITVNGVKVIKSDLLASNGVIHVLEKPILPKKKNFIHLNARRVLYAVHSTRFIKLLDKHGLGDYLDQVDGEPLTILAPPDERFDDSNIPNSQVKSWLQYHFVRGRYRPSDLVNDQLLKTESNQDLGDEHHQRLRVTLTEQDPNIYSKNQFYIEKQSIQFGKSSVLKDPIEIGDNVIVYPISGPLSLPIDTLRLLPVNLELTTFVATLYASGADQTLDKAHGVTLFSPTNEAFGRLGLLTKHLLQPDSKEKLDKVVRYHVARGVFYENSTQPGEHQVETLSDGPLTLNKTDQGFFVRGSGALDGNDRSVIGQVIKKDILTASGVIHTIDRVQLPSSLKVSNRDLLSTEGTNQLLELIEYSNLTHEILDGHKAYTILAPSDRAFAKINLGHLRGDPHKLVNFAKLHIIPGEFPVLDAGEIKNGGWWTAQEDIGYTGKDYPTLIEDTVLVISKNVGGGYSVKVKGSSQDSADIVDIGRSSSRGGVLLIDRVLVPPEEVRREGLNWWQITLIVMASIVGLVLLIFALYYVWGWYQTRRVGYLNIGEE